MFLDSELYEVLQAKARLGIQADLRREVIRMELLSLRSRVKRTFSSLSLGFGLAGKLLDYLRVRRGG